jgi:hypothetical protein
VGHTEYLRVGRGILPRTVNKQAVLGNRGFRGSRGAGPATKSRKDCEVAEGGKLHRRGVKTHLPHEL